MAKSKNKLTLKQIDDLFDIDLDRGEIYWKDEPHIHSRVRGRLAGNCGLHDRTHMVQHEGVRYSSHCIIVAKATGKWPDYVVDRVNGDPRDDRISNQRPATISQTNAKRRSSGAASGYKWVMRRKTHWQAAVSFNGERRHKCFQDPQAAHRWAKKQARIMHGAFYREA